MFFLHPKLIRATAICTLSAVAVCVIACVPTSERTTKSTVIALDDFGAALPTDASFAARVVSLNPTATEIIFAMGAQRVLVGRSRWDLYPAAASEITAVGDGINPNIEAVLAQHPTLVILYATASNRAAAAAFARAGVKTMTLRVDHIAQFVSFTQQLGVALGQQSAAQAITDSVQHTLAAVRAVTNGAHRRSAVWPVSRQPVLVIGRGSYMNELLEIAGARNVFDDMDAPSPPVNVEEIANRDPDVVIASQPMADVLLQSAPWRVVNAVRMKRIIPHDPDLTGRPSVVLGMAAVRLARALHPELASRLPTSATPKP